MKVKGITYRLLFFVSAMLLYLCGYSQTTQTFSTPGTYNWNCPAGVTSITVECWGGGGGGGFGRSTNGAAGGGGGGGAYASSVVTVVPGTTYTVVVGGGGAGGTAAGVAAISGGNSSFNTTTVVAAGGTLGTGVSANASGAGGAGGTIAASTGTTRNAGGSGANGVNGTGASAGGGGGGAAASVSGNGASGVLLVGGTGVSPAGNGGSGGRNTQGGPGTSYGGGGAGGNRNNTNRAGGAGAAGCVQLTYTCPTPSPISSNAGPNQILSSCTNSTTLAANTPPAGASGIWTVISGNATITTPSSPTTTVTGLSLGTTVTLGWTVQNGSCDSKYDEMNVVTSYGTSCFCTPDFPSGVFSITRVQFGTIDNSSATVSLGTTPDWEDYTAFSTSLTPGVSYPITITATGSGTTNTFYITAFFDWNNDGDFYDTGEEYRLGTFANNSASVSGNIYVPSNANTGSLRMRVINQFGGYSDPCNTIGYGQAEDYSVSITALSNCSGTPTAGSVLPASSNITTQDQLLLYWSELPQAGFSYQWQYLDGFGVWQNVSGGTTSAYYLSGLSEGTYNYRLNITCTNSGLSATSASAQVIVVLGYCTPSALNCTLNDKITRVQFNTLDNNSGATCNSPSGYSNYTGLAPTSLNIGLSYNLTITVANGTGSHSAGVWFDFNRNGVFTDAGEFFSIAQGTILPSSSTTVSIAIPTNALTGNTRMRIQYGWGPTILSSWVCYTNLTYGETEDYTVNIVCPAVPNDVTGRSPANALPLPCGSAAALSWDSHSCATGYKVYLGTTNPPVTLVSTSASTSYYTGNLSNSTVYYWKVVPYNGGGDGTGSVWSFTTQSAINVVTSTDEEGCADGGLCLDVSGGTFPDYFWYDVPVGGAPVATGTHFCPAGLTDTTTFYVSNVYEGSPTSINAAASSSVVCGGTRGYGNMFNIRAKAATIEVTGLSVRFNDLGTAGSSYRPVKVYYRTSTFVGNANSSSGWTLLLSTTVNVPNTTTVPTYFDVPSFYVPAGTTYGVYVVYDNQYLSGAGVYANSDLELVTGSSICGGEFSGEITDRSFEGSVYYTISCSSPTSSVVATPYVSNNFVSLVSSSVTGLVEQCTEYGWTYYSKPATPNVWLFAIYKNGNTFTATVDITKGAGVYQDVNPAESAGSFLMGRYWNISLTSGSINPAQPVSIRWFFDPAEITAAVNQRNTVMAGYPDAYPTAWRWFKSVGVAFDPAVNIDGNTFNFTNVTLTTTGALSISGAPYSGTINGVAYVDLDGITSFSGGAGGVGFSRWNPAPLPVELLSLLAECSGNSVHLVWKTASEVNNDYFTLERSFDSENWETVAKIKGSGTTNETQSYGYLDKAVFDQTVYYRLSQTDFDGSIKILNSVTSNCSGAEKTANVYVFPNPATSVLNVIIENDESDSGFVLILDETGRVLRSFPVEHYGETSKYQIDLSGISTGSYYLKCVFEKNLLPVQKFIVQE